MNSIEREYFSRMSNMPPIERLMRSVSMFETARIMLKNKILQREPHINPRELKRQVAMQLYLTDRSAQKLLKAME